MADALNALASFEAVVDEITTISPATKGQMFGMPCLKVNGKAFAGFHEGAMVFKLGPPEHGKALVVEGSHLFDPSKRERPMKEWVVIPFAHVSLWLSFAEAALQYVS